MKNILFTVLLVPALLAADTPPAASNNKIDRHALVTRHNVSLDKLNSQCVLQVGNGEIAFGVDGTGLQTFYGNTLSQWGWHSSPLPQGQRVEDFCWTDYDCAGRKVPYMVDSKDQRPLSSYLYANPHRLELGRLAMKLTKANGQVANQLDIKDIRQKLDLWTGIITSQFTFDGQPVSVQTCCDPKIDELAVKIESPLIAKGQLRVELGFPYADARYFTTQTMGDWTQPDAHQTVMTPAGTTGADFARTVDSTKYAVSLRWSPGATLQGPPPEAPVKPLKIIKAEFGADATWVNVTEKVSSSVKFNRIELQAGSALVAKDALKGVQKKVLKVTYSLGGEEKSVEVPDGKMLEIQTAPLAQRYVLSSTGNTLEVSCAFSPQPGAKPSDFAKAKQANEEYWPQFWNSGGAMDFSGSTDPRAAELERRIVLSQYLLAVNEAGSLPPQESGLFNNGWYGKFHTEMYWWHATHYALWDRWPLWDRSIGFLKTLLPKAQAIAQKQGYKGARWPKMLGPDGVESPNGINPLLIWQQPHQIFYAEMDYRAHPTKETLEKWREIVSETAAFMASYPEFDKASGRYVLGPPLKTVPENTDALTTRNPAFELSYWRFGLRIAQQWRERMGLAREPEWDKVLKGLAPLPQQDGVYLMQEGMADTYTKMNNSHASLIGALGMLPGDGTDPVTMKATMDKVSQTWDWKNTWGWDFPMLAMCAARVGDPKTAVDMMLHPSPGFQFNVCGLATGGPFPYFPSNGGLLYAAAFMAAGWDGAPARNAPGFPNDGSWVVKWEGLKKAP